MRTSKSSFLLVCGEIFNLRSGESQIASEEEQLELSLDCCDLEEDFSDFSRSEVLERVFSEGVFMVRDQEVNSEIKDW